MKRIIWIAQDKKHKIIAMWWSGCVQPFSQWKHNVKNIGATYVNKYEVWL